MVDPVGVVLQSPETATGQKTNRCLLEIVSRFYPLIRLLQMMQESSLDENFLYSEQKYYGAPSRSRTYNQRLRRPLLYPVELWMQRVSMPIKADAVYGKNS